MELAISLFKQIALLCKVAKTLSLLLKFKAFHIVPSNCNSLFINQLIIGLLPPFKGLAVKVIGDVVDEAKALLRESGEDVVYDLGVLTERQGDEEQVEMKCSLA